MSGWKPIATAPKNGTYCILHTNESTIPVIAQWVLFNGWTGWRDQEGETYINATHWYDFGDGKPMPDAPEVE